MYEIRLAEPPKKITLLDGYLTVDAGGWHFHLCIGEHRGSTTHPVPEALARVRRASKAAFFRQWGGSHGRGSWGFRMWNETGDQMLTEFFPNPYLDEEMNPKSRPDWSWLGLWNRLRLKHLPGAREWVPKEDG